MISGDEAESSDDTQDIRHVSPHTTTNGIDGGGSEQLGQQAGNVAYLFRKPPSVLVHRVAGERLAPHAYHLGDLKGTCDREGVLPVRQRIDESVRKGQTPDPIP